MAVLVNFKICDNAKECSGIEVCPTQALSWDEKEETIVIDNNKCISCGACETACPIGAFSVARDDEEYKRLEKEIEEDPRTIKDLFVDRYGAAPLSEFFMINADEIDDKVKNDCITLIECYQDDTIECLLKSIPIKELTSDLPKDTLFYKVENDESLNKYELEEFPALLIFKNGKLLGHIDGYYTVDDKEVVLTKINDILNNN